MLCIRREDREMRGNFVHCHCSLWPGLLGLATENKTKKLQKLLSVCLGAAAAAAPPLTTFTSTPTLRRQCLVNQCRMSHTVSTLPPPPRNNNNNSNDSPSDPLLATHATKTFIGERKDSTAVHCPIRILLVWWQNNLTTFSLIRFYIYCFLRCKI